MRTYTKLALYAKAKTNAYKKVFEKWHWQCRHQAKLRGILNIFYAEQRRRKNFFHFLAHEQALQHKKFKLLHFNRRKNFSLNLGKYHGYSNFSVCSDEVYFGKTQMKWWIKSILPEQLCSLVHVQRFWDILTEKHICPYPPSAILASGTSLGARGRRREAP